MTPFFSFENNLFLEEYFGRDKDGCKRYYFDFVGNKVKGQISKWVFQENKACQIFRKTNISYPLIRTRTCAYQGVRNVRFSENLTCFVFLKHRFEIRPFAVLPTISGSWKSFHVINFRPS